MSGTDLERAPVYSVARHLRERAQMSIRELERDTGINRGRLSQIERGVAPTEPELNAMLDAIDAHVQAQTPRLRR